MGPRDEFRPSYPTPNNGLRWALAVMSVIAVAAVITAIAVWVNTRPVERSANTVPRSDLEQITGQEVRQKFPGPPVVILCPEDPPRRIGASVDCVMKRAGRQSGITIEITQINSPTDVLWHWTLGPEINGN